MLPFLHLYHHLSISSEPPPLPFNSNLVFRSPVMISRSKLHFRARSERVISRIACGRAGNAE